MKVGTVMVAGIERVTPPQPRSMRRSTAGKEAFLWILGRSVLLVAGTGILVALVLSGAVMLLSTSARAAATPPEMTAIGSSRLPASVRLKGRTAGSRWPHEATLTGGRQHAGQTCTRGAETRCHSGQPAGGMEIYKGVCRGTRHRYSRHPLSATGVPVFFTGDLPA